MLMSYTSSARPVTVHTHPPCNQMIHGSVLFTSAGAVSVPFAPVFSNAQKNSVSFGCPALFTGMFPANMRGSPLGMLGSFSVTSKSASKCEYSHTHPGRGKGRGGKGTHISAMRG